MSGNKQPQNKVKKTKKFEKYTKEDPDSPVEVIIYDCLLHERVIAEHRNESKWWFGTRMYKVYHPAFTETPDFSRWVFKLGRVLGPIGGAFIDTRAEREVIAALIRE